MNITTGNTHTDIAALLIDLEAALRRADHWQREPIAPTALASTEPFAVDTMTLAQWLQFIFIPRMHALAAAGQSLPGRCEIAPMAEEYFGESAAVVALIRELDRLISAA